LLSPALGLSALAQRGQAGGKVTLAVLSLEITPTASPDNDLVHLKVRLTNSGDTPVVYTNNRFVLTDSKGVSHLVSRPWYPQGAALNPGESVDVDRIYFEIPKKSNPAELSLMWRRFVLGSVKLKS
jgi:hypothetical protein